MKAPGHESGHADTGAPPVGFSWETVVLAFVSEAGGWAALSDELVRRARGVAEVPSDPSPTLRQRAEALSQLVEDDDLLRRLRARWG